MLKIELSIEKKAKYMHEIIKLHYFYKYLPIDEYWDTSDPENIAFLKIFYKCKYFKNCYITYSIKDIITNRSMDIILKKIKKRIDNIMNISNIQWGEFPYTILEMKYEPFKLTMNNSLTVKQIQKHLKDLNSKPNYKTNNKNKILELLNHYITSTTK